MNAPNKLNNESTPKSAFTQNHKALVPDESNNCHNEPNNYSISEPMNLNQELFKINPPNEGNILSNTADNDYIRTDHLPGPKVKITHRGNFNQPKNNIACLFILRREWCAKRDKCDFSHSNSVIDFKRRQISHTPKSAIPCPFLRRKASCIKGPKCGERISRPFMTQPPDISYPTHPQSPSNFLDKLQEVMTSMNQLQICLQRIEGTRYAQPMINQHLFRTQFLTMSLRI